MKILVGTTRDGTKVADVSRAKYASLPPFTGVANTKRGIRLADFYQNGRFRGWTNHTPRNLGDTADHEMDMVHLEWCNNGHDAASLGLLDIRIGRGDFVGPSKPAACHQRRSDQRCYNCGAKGLTSISHHCWNCGIHRTCESCRPEGKSGECADAQFPHSAEFHGKYGSVRWLLLGPIPTANQIRTDLGLPSRRRQ